MCDRLNFFFSSRRRHTRSLRDWSSDVCSSDLPAELGEVAAVAALDVVDTGAAAILYLAHLQAAEALARVAGEAARLAELTVVDHVEAGLDLLVDDGLDRAGQQTVELTLFARAHGLAQVGRAWQYARVRHKYSVRASLHSSSSFYSVPDSEGQRGVPEMLENDRSLTEKQLSASCAEG